MTHNPANYHARLIPRDAVFACFVKMADEKGILAGSVVGRAAKRLRCHESLVAKDLAYFTVAGSLIKLARDKYLLRGFSKPVDAKPRVQLGIHQTPSGIEAVTHLRPFVGMTGAMRFVPISLPRVPSLEKPLE